jgi:hypothetical protein
VHDRLWHPTSLAWRRALRPTHLAILASAGSRTLARKAPFSISKGKRHALEDIVEGGDDHRHGILLQTVKRQTTPVVVGSSRYISRAMAFLRHRMMSCVALRGSVPAPGGWGASAGRFISGRAARGFTRPRRRREQSDRSSGPGWFGWRRC